MRRGTVAVLASLLMAFALVAHAAWSGSANGTVSATSQGMPVGNTPTATVSGTSITVAWSASSFSDGTPVSGYTIKRYDWATLDAQLVLSNCAGTISALTCSENGVPSGSWRYTVTPKHGSWVGDESAKSTAVTVGPSWSGTGSMTKKRHTHTATLLPNGKVLVAGGVDTLFGVLKESDLYDPATGTWTATGSMSVPRFFHTATLLPNGKVLVAGGYGHAHNSSAELYDPATGTWTATGSMTVARLFHSASLLPNGKVLVAGGSNGGYLASAELYDPAAGTWTATGSMASSREGSTASLLPNGKVLVAGGFNGGYLVSAELYDPAAGTWTATGSMATARYFHTASLLPNGTVLVAGGSNGSYLASAELYDPAAGTWTATGSMASSREGHSATLLPDGKVLVAGGFNGAYLARAELYDPETGAEWTAPESMASGRRAHTATLLPDGKVLVSGGSNGSSLASAELYSLPVGYKVTISGNTNVPTMKLENTSLDSVDITEFSFTIGDTSKNFDYAINQTTSGGVAATLVAPDTLQAVGRSNFVTYTFTAFPVGGTLQFDTDVDIDSANTVEDYSTVFFNNGATANSQITVTFEDGTVLTQTVTETPIGPPYVFTQSS